MMHTCLGGQSFTIDKRRFIISGRHRLDITVTVIGPAADEGPRPLLRKSYQFNIRRKLIFYAGEGYKKSIVAIIIVMHVALRLCDCIIINNCSI